MPAVIVDGAKVEGYKQLDVYIWLIEHELGVTSSVRPQRQADTTVNMDHSAYLTYPSSVLSYTTNSITTKIYVSTMLNEIFVRMYKIA